MAEAGLPGLQMSAWYGIYMPASTPKAVQGQVHDAVNQVVAMPQTQARLGAVLMIPLRLARKCIQRL